MDVDDTITVSLPDAPAGRDDVFGILAGMMVDEDGITAEEALRRIHASGDVEHNCISNFFPQLGIDLRGFWVKLEAYLRPRIRVAEDATYLIKRLAERGIPLHSATTNSRMMTLAKLAIGELATMEGSPYFTHYFGGDSFGDPGGKYSSRFYSDILKRLQADAPTVVHVGDDPMYDYAAAHAVGIQVILIDRKQREPWILLDGGVRVNSLRLVDEWIVAV